MMKKNFLPGLLCLVLLSACSTNKDTGYADVTPVQIENTDNDINLPEESTADIRQTSPSEMYEPGQSTAAGEIYEGEYAGNTISDPDYDGLEIQKNEDDTYRIQIKIPFLTKLYECTGYRSENRILFSTCEWGTDKKVEGSISFDDASATVTFTSGWYQTATTERSYQYHKTSDTPHLENCPDARPDYSSFTGEYCDANDDPSLEIRLNGDGSYLIQINIFREIGYDACIGSLSEEKMSFTSEERGGVSGSITLDNDLAIVRFEQIGYFENATVTTYLFHKTSDNPNSEMTAEELFDLFINGSIGAISSADSTSIFYITDLNMDSDEWDSYSVGERVDLDNDGENELIICGPYGGIYLDARDNKVYEFAVGEGTGYMLSYVVYNGATWLMYSNREHAEYELFHMEKFEGADNLAAKMDFSREPVDGNNIESGMKYTLNGTEISYDEFEQLAGKICATEEITTK